MTQYHQSSDDLWENLNLQARYLKESSSSFDGGFEGEAQRLAVTVRVLVHDTSASHSLLKLLEIKDNIQFHDTGYFTPYPVSRAAESRSVA